MKKLILLSLLAMPSLALATDAFDRAGLQSWLSGDIARGRGFPVKNSLPRGDAIKYCAGAGCKIKIPFAFTALQIRKAAEAMDLARRDHACRADTANCERSALRYAVREMDRIVRDAKLERMSLDEVVTLSITKDSQNNPENFADRIGRKQQFLRDCVDQAANGSSFLIVLASHGLVKHHRVLAPGKMNLGPQPHYFTRLQEIAGAKRVFRFDLYQTPRTGFDKLPGVEQRD